MSGVRIARALRSIARNARQIRCKKNGGLQDDARLLLIEVDSAMQEPESGEGTNIIPLSRNRGFNNLRELDTLERAMFEPPEISGVDEVVAWFGRWPTFHDAEVLSITLERPGHARVSIHAFEKTAEVDVSGHYILTKHTTVTFSFEGFPLDQSGLTNIKIEDFNHQNVLSSAAVNKIAGGYELILDGCYGVTGVIIGECMTVSVQPGIPSP
jgi:hypothetical protein